MLDKQRWGGGLYRKRLKPCNNSVVVQQLITDGTLGVMRAEAVATVASVNIWSNIV